MDKEVRFSSLKEFTAELKNKGMNKIALAEIDEKRAVQKEENLVEVVRFRKVELLAYKDAVIYKYIFDDNALENTGVDDIARELLDQGFQVTRKNRNIT